MADFNADITETGAASDQVGGSTFLADCVEAGSALDLIDASLATPLTPTLFRMRFPGFQNPALYSDFQINFYIDLSSKMLIADRWGNMLEEGQQLFSAHFLALDQLAQVAGVGSVPGTAVGVLTNGSVDKVSYSRDVQSIMEDNAGHWGMTTYGLQYLRFARMMGTGPLQVGLPGGVGAFGWMGQGNLPQSASVYGPGWPGPMPGAYGW